MSGTKTRIIAGSVMGLGAIAAGVAEYFGIPAVRWLAVVIVAGMIIEFALCIIKSGVKKLGVTTSAITFAWLLLMLVAAYYVGGRPWIVLLLLMTISAADIGAWFFGRMIGGDKMWERLSPGKTWAGQIAGIACGTFASVMYGLLGTDTFMPQLLWIGISISLMSQYGDITESWLKRKLGVKDSSNIIPGHGGIADRFDGWIYVLPIVWLVML